MTDPISALINLLVLCFSSLLGFGVTLLGGAALSWTLHGPLWLSLTCGLLGLLCAGLGVLSLRRS